MTDMLTTWANSFRGNSRPKTIAPNKRWRMNSISSVKRLRSAVITKNLRQN